MVRSKIKWKCVPFTFFVFFKVCVYSLPINRSSPSLVITDSVFENIVTTDSAIFQEEVTEITTTTVVIEEDKVDNSTEIIPFNTTNIEASENVSSESLLRQVRPGQDVRQYAVEISYEGGSFSGRAVMDVHLTADSRENPIVFHLEDLDVDRVLVGVLTDANAEDAAFDAFDGIIEIFPNRIATSYIVIIEYSGSLDGVGLYQGSYNDDTYIAMNLHPTNARRVFPCIDEPTEESTISFTFNNIDYTHLVANSMLEENSANQFRPLQGPAHLWGMVAHNLNNRYFPTQNVELYVRSGVFNQESQALVAINHYFHALNEWTEKPYLEIVLNQDGRMNLIALPDSDRDWYALSTVCIWEPYVLMELSHSVQQRKVGLTKIAEAMARQWFGYVIYPENWRHQWITTGLTKYAAYDILRDFQHDPLGADVSLLDVNTLFITEVIQESLLIDAYRSTQPLEPDEDLFEEPFIRNNVNGLVNYKAPALLRMLRLSLGGPDDDYVKEAAKALLHSRALQTVNSFNFHDAIQSGWLGNDLIGDIEEFLDPWVSATGYPVVNVGLRQGGLLVTQERFSFSPTEQLTFLVPLTFTTSINPNFDTENIYPTMMMEQTTTINMNLDEEDWALFNIQGQGYYRVNYDFDLWERIIEALEDPDRREEIHPLNRATLVDDALNLARASKIQYETAFRVVLSMEHETEYAVWKAFVRNMNFLRKRLVALVEDDEELDPDIYLRMVRRTIGTFEDEIGFHRDLLTIEPAMDSLTRGLVMDHACRANYEPCIAAAVDWFYDPDNNEVVNPNIPSDIRPAVFCTMARVGDEDVISALYDRLEIEASSYERVVILESLGCSQDEGFISTLLEETIANNSPYNTEERVRIFKAVAEGSYQNARIALNFISLRTNEIRNMYGGPDKLEEIIFTLAENIPNDFMANDFTNWINSVHSNIDDSMPAAERARDLVIENVDWDRAHMEQVYEWIDENGAPALLVSVLLITLSFVITIFNY